LVNFFSFSFFFPIFNKFLQGVTQDQLLSWLPKSLRHKYQTSHKDEKIISTKDLEHILARAIEETKQIVKRDFESTLQQRLMEQQHSFAQYNQDYLGRNHHNKPVAMDYIS
jgi:hypothetical protein